MDFKQIAQTPILDVAKLLGLVLTEKQANLRGNTVIQYVGRCPISKIGDDTAFKITPELNRFVCFCPACRKREKQGGDCIEMVSRIRGIDHREAAASISGAGKAAENPPTQQEAASSSNSAGFDPLTYLASLAIEHDALKDLGLLPATLVAFQAGYAGKGLLRGRLAVAWHDVTGELKFFIGVSILGSAAQYLLPKGIELPYWYNTHRVDDGAEVHIVPSILHVMEAWQNGEGNTLAPLRPITAASLTSLQSLCVTKNLTVAF